MTMMQARRNVYRVLFALWVGLILIIVVPWATFTPQAYWEHVRWIPFVSPPIKLRDVTANVLLYVPFGYLSARLRDRRQWLGIGYGLLLTVVTELTQVYSPRRFPSTTDVTCNVFGAWLGMAVVNASKSHISPGAGSFGLGRRRRP
jgi:glycopeptide antibiotics resistance protein